MQKKLLALTSELMDLVSLCNEINIKVSEAAVGWHIAHTTLVIKNVIGQLEQTNPKNYKWSFNKNRFLVLSLKKIPRGKAKAPQAVQVKNSVTIDELVKYINGANEKINLLNSINRNSYFAHPFLGLLNLKSTIKFLKIHTKHHISIINDILKPELNLK